MNGHHDSLSQSFLEEQARRRIAQAGYELGSDVDLATFEKSLRQRLSGPVAFLVLRSFDLETYLRATLSFLEMQSSERLSNWARCFTRTVFLVGRPRRLATAFPFDHLADDGSMAWLLSDDSKLQTRLPRLLQRLKTSGKPPLPDSLTYGSVKASELGSRQVHAWVAVAGMALEDYLVHLNHLVCESFIFGAFRCDDHLTLRHVSHIDSLQLRPGWLRIHRDQTAGERLKLFGYLGAEDDLSAPSADRS